MKNMLTLFSRILSVETSPSMAETLSVRGFRSTVLLAFFLSVVFFTPLSSQTVDFDPANIIFHYHGEADDSQAGNTLTSLGDINGDGFDDIAVASYYPPGTHVFFGGDPVDSVSDMCLQGKLGAANPIDLDGDGIEDVATSWIGVLYFYKGYGDSLGSVPYDSLVRTDDYFFGLSVATGYADGDNLGDLLTYEPWDPFGPKIYYYSGCPAIDTLEDWTFDVSNYTHTCSGFGFIDFDGDGNLDIYVGMSANNDTASYVYVFFGPDFASEPDVIIGHPLDYYPEWEDEKSFADDVENVGDIDGDGWDDLSVQYYYKAFIYKCGPGSDTLWDYQLDDYSHLTSSAGDVNGDGYNDLLAGDARGMDGAVDLYLGGSPFDTQCDMIIYRGDLPPLSLDGIGYSLSPAGDFNGDGYDDFMFACRNTLVFYGDVFVVQGGAYLPTDVKEAEDPVLPHEYELGQNYPNPFNSSTRIEFSLTQNDTVALTIYNVLGQKVITLIDQSSYPAGQHVFEWDGRLGDNTLAPSGVYFYQLTTLHTGESKKMVMVK